MTNSFHTLNKTHDFRSLPHQRPPPASTPRIFFSAVQVFSYLLFAESSSNSVHSFVSLTPCKSICLQVSKRAK